MIGDISNAFFSSLDYLESLEIDRSSIDMSQNQDSIIHNNHRVLDMDQQREHHYITHDSSSSIQSFTDAKNNDTVMITAPNNSTHHNNSTMDIDTVSKQPTSMIPISNANSLSEELSSSSVTKETLSTVENSKQKVTIVSKAKMTEGFDQSESNYLIKQTMNNEHKWTSQDVLSRLYNYMKISEMDRYGIEVFETIWKKYMHLLSEDDINTLITSYWCNGKHLECIVRYRGCSLKNNQVLTCKINETIINQAMCGGASIDKIQTMLRLWRLEINNLNVSCKNEVNFFYRNCQYRFWNLEVCANAFKLNGLLSNKLSQYALNKFVQQIYQRGLSSPDWSCGNSSKTANKGSSIQYSMNAYSGGGGGGRFIMSKSKRLQRWCALVELLSANGAKMNNVNVFDNIPEIKQSYVYGLNTYKFKLLKIAEKNRLIQSYNLELPVELWSIILDCF